MLVQRLDFGPDVREALRFTFERWNGNGYPAHAQGEAIPLAMRVVHLSHDMEAIGRLFSPEHALEAARDRRDRTYDPALADLFVEHGRDWFDRLGETEPWDAVLALEPEPHRMLDGEELDDALTVAADFIDLKSPYMGGHSRRCARARRRRRPGARARRGGRHHAPPRGARARLRHHRRAELDLGQARPAHADGVRSRRASPDADRADAAPLAGAGRPEPGRVRAPREVRRVRLPQARAGRRRRSRSVRPGGDGDLRRADHRASGPSAVLARRTRPPSFAGSNQQGVLEPRASRAVLVAAGHGEPRAPVGQAAATIRAGSPGARSTCCASRPGDSRRARSPIGSTSRPRPPTTTSSTSTARSASRREPPPRSGRCSTPSSSETALRQFASRRRGVEMTS